MIERGEHSTIAAPHSDGGVGPRDGAATEIGAREGESASGRRARGTEQSVDNGSKVGDADGVACLSVRLLNVVCVCVRGCLFVCFVCVFVCGFVCVCGCMCVGERTGGALAKRTKREHKYMSVSVSIFSKPKTKERSNGNRWRQRYHMGIATETNVINSTIDNRTA